MIRKLQLVAGDRALAGRQEVMPVANRHYVNGNPLSPPFPDGMALAMFGLGCFWGAEKKFWEFPKVYSTSVGYSGGFTPNPTYREVCTGRTGHNEVVRVVYPPDLVSYASLVRLFWESHDPTQGMRQGNDVGTQYRSAIYVYDEAQKVIAEQTRQQYQQALARQGYSSITTEIVEVSEFYYAEDYHQQYLAKNPNGYCGLGGTGVALT